jgi:hypothetical protein
MISCRVNGPNLPPNIPRDTDTENQEQRIQFRIRKLIDEFHKKVTKWACENYNTIVLPKFEAQKMILKVRGKLTQRLLEICLLGVTLDLGL